MGEHLAEQQILALWLKAALAFSDNKIVGNGKKDELQQDTRDYQFLKLVEATRECLYALEKTTLRHDQALDARLSADFLLLECGWLMAERGVSLCSPSPLQANFGRNGTSQKLCTVEQILLAHTGVWNDTKPAYLPKLKKTRELRGYKEMIAQLAGEILLPLCAKHKLFPKGLNAPRHIREVDMQIRKRILDLCASYRIPNP